MAVVTNPIHIDNVTRIYKNSAGDTIAIDKVAITETRVGAVRTPAIESSLTRINEGGASQSRSVTSIQQIGHYDQFSTSGGNYTQVVYLGTGGLGNLTVDLTSLTSIGNTV